MKIYLYDRMGLYTGIGEAKPCAMVEGEFLIPAYATDVEPPKYDPETEIAVFESNMPGNGDSKILECKWYIYPKQVLIFDEVIGRGRPMTKAENNTYINENLIKDLSNKGFKIKGLIQEQTEIFGGLVYLCDLTKKVFTPYNLNSGQSKKGKWIVPNSDWSLIDTEVIQ